MLLPTVPVRFDLSGRSAGQFSARGKHCLIRYNPWIFARYFAENLATTVPHEVAHYAVYLHWGRRAKPHGVEWRALMHALGADPAVTFSLDLSGLPVRRQQRYAYHCACSEQALSTTRHRRAQSGRARYACRICGHTLRYAGAAPESG
jgi:SprT protein